MSAHESPDETGAVPIPLSERTAQVQRDAQELVFILSRYMLRSASGVTYLRLRPKADDPRKKAVALKVERLV